MFLDSFETDRGVWLQACISFPFLGETPALAGPIAAILATQGMVTSLALGFRIVITCTGELRRTLILLAPESSKNQLRRFAASFCRLELIVPGSVQFPPDSETLDSDVFAGFPVSHCRTVPSGFGNAGVWFAADFRLALFLDQLVREARSLGFNIGYQMHARPFEGRAPAIRAARHNLLNAQSLEGLPPGVLRLQQNLTERLGSASHLIEEIVGVDPPSGRNWLLAALDRLFSANHSQLMFGSPGFGFADYSDILAAGFHSSLGNAIPPDEVCAMAVAETEISRLVAWQPGPLLSRELTVVARPPAEPVDLTSLPDDAPVPYSGRDSYLFISYKHSDLPAILPFLRELAMVGLRFWYDRGIPGASEWMHVLEERIENSELLVVFLSQSAVDSKYVRREILMADTLNKPILTLTLGRPELRWGLKLVLPQYQMHDAYSQPIPDVVRQAIEARGSQ